MADSGNDHKKLLRSFATRDERLAFWVGHVRTVHVYSL